MPRRVIIELTDEQHAELQRARDHHVKAYVREKAAAILKIAEEHLSALEVAQHRLLKKRDDNTVRSWIKRYQQAGIAGLLVQGKRGRKPAFPPSSRRPASRRAGARGAPSQPSSLRS